MAQPLTQLPIQPESIKNKIVISAAVSGIIASFLFFFGPSQMYLSNAPMFHFVYTDVLFKFLPIFIGGWILGFALLSLMLLFPVKWNIHPRFIALGTGAAIMLWIQGNILVWNYGVLDGKPIQWAKFMKNGLIDGFLWIVILVTSIFLFRVLYKYSKKICFFLLIIQLVTTSILYFQNPEAQTARKHVILDTSTQFDFSSSQNIIILLVDGFESDLFQELIDENPQYKKDFEGFTYFRNSLAGFPLTLPSIPFMLAGRAFDNSILMKDFIKDVYYGDTSIPKVLRKNGYRVEILMDCGRCFEKDPNLISNLKSTTVEMYNSQAGFLFDLTLFRFAPHFLKPKIYNNQQWRFLRMMKEAVPENLARDTKVTEELMGLKLNLKSVQELQDLAFGVSMVSEGKVTTKTKVFKFYHLDGVHPPFYMDDKLEYKVMPNNRKSWKKMAIGALEIVHLYLEKLKRLNAFDNSIIIVLGDHGHSAGQFKVTFPKNWNETNGQIYGEADRNYERLGKGILESGIPLMLVKPLNEREELKTSDNPISLSDVPATIFDLLGIQGNFMGESMFKIAPDSQRERVFTFFSWQGGEEGFDHLPNPKRFKVKGHSWLDKNWTRLEINKNNINESAK